ncbi:hypothetical protein IFM89_022678, partial [Coptis chinensis]
MMKRDQEIVLAKKTTKETDFRSRNLTAERNRRAKLKERLMALRSVVPTITNMKKETIIDDAVNYVIELKKFVKDLRDQLSGAEAALEEEEKQEHKNGITLEMEKLNVEGEVKVTQINEKKNN